MPPSEKTSPEGPRRLGSAVRQARRALGFRNQRSFAAAIGVSERMIWAIENGREAGDATLEALGLFLRERVQGWSVDTPRRILDGGQVPDLDLIEPEKPAQARLDLTWNNVRANIRSLVSHNPEGRDALARITRLRKRHGPAGLTDSRLLDAVEQALKDEH